MSEPQLRLVSPPPADATGTGTGTIGCFDLPALSTQVALALASPANTSSPSSAPPISCQITRAA
jgi:hypothetical protein